MLKFQVSGRGGEESPPPPRWNGWLWHAESGVGYLGILQHCMQTSAEQPVIVKSW